MWWKYFDCSCAAENIWECHWPVPNFKPCYARNLDGDQLCDHVVHEHLMMITLYHCVIISCTNIWGWSQYMYHCHGQPSMHDTSGNDVIWVKIFGLWLFNVHHHHCVISGWSNGKYNFAQVLRSTAPRPPFIWKASALDWWASNKLTHKMGVHARQMGPKPDLGAYQRTRRF